MSRRALRVADPDDVARLRFGLESVPPTRANSVIAMLAAPFDRG